MNPLRAVNAVVVVANRNAGNVASVHASRAKQENRVKRARRVRHRNRRNALNVRRALLGHLALKRRALMRSREPNRHGLGKRGPHVRRIVVTMMVARRRKASARIYRAL